MSDSERTARFGVFEADYRTGELRRSGRKVGVQDQPFRVLTILLDHSGELVTRQELQERIWPDDTLIDFDHALTTAVKKLRHILRDSAQQPRYIETLPKKGYRFIAPVEFLSPADSESAGEQQPTSREPVEPTTKQARRLRNQRNALAAALAVAVGLLWWLAVGTGKPPDIPVRRFSFTPASIAGSRERQLAISPDGRHIVYKAPGEEGCLWLRHLDREEPRRLEGTEGAAAPFWSPNSEFIAFGTANELKRVSIHGGAPQTICRLAQSIYAGGAWSPDGNSLTFSTGLPPRLYTVSVDGGRPRVLLEPVVTENGGANLDITYLPPTPSRNRILFAAGGPAGYEMVAMDLATGAHEMLGAGTNPVYSEPGYVIFQAPGGAGGIWVLPFSVEQMRATGPAQPLIAGGRQPDLSADGTLVYMDRGGEPAPQQLVLRDRSGERIGTVGRLQDRIRSPVFSPDGRLVAVCGTEGDENDIWIHSVDTPTKTRVTFDPVVEGDPVWSHDGREILYRADVTAETELRRVNIQTRGEPVAITASGLAKRSTDWTADSRHVVYAAFDYQTRSDLWLLPLDEGGAGGIPRPLVQTSFNEVAGRISPDGKLLAYCSDESGEYEVYVTTFPIAGTRWQASIGGGCQPQWSKESGELFYVWQDALLAVAVNATDGFAAGRTKILFRDPSLKSTSPNLSNYDVTQDGQRFVLLETSPQPETEPTSIHVVQNWRGASQGLLPSSP